MTRENLKHAVINQIETDLQHNEFEALDELLEKLMMTDTSNGLLIAYLSGSSIKNADEGLTYKRY